MNKEVKKYINQVKGIIPFYSKDKRGFIFLLSERLNEYFNENNKSSYQDIIDEFGTPNEVAGSYIESLETEFIVKQLNRKKFVKIVLTIIIVLSITVWGFEMYRLNQLYEEAKASINGYYEETIEYEYVEENSEEE